MYGLFATKRALFGTGASPNSIRPTSFDAQIETGRLSKVGRISLAQGQFIFNIGPHDHAEAGNY